MVIVVVLVGNAHAQAMMQLIHHGLRDLAGPLHVDDTAPAAPAYYFDLKEPRATVCGVKGMANPHLQSLLAAAHALVVVSDGPATDPTVAAQTLSARLPEPRRERVYAVRIGDSEQAREALLAVVDDLVSARRPTTRPSS